MQDASDRDRVSFSVSTAVDNPESHFLRPESPRRRVSNPRERRALGQQAQTGEKMGPLLDRKTCEITSFVQFLPQNSAHFRTNPVVHPGARPTNPLEPDEKRGLDFLDVSVPEKCRTNEQTPKITRVTTIQNPQ